jgi:16S rRNA (cytidine1402-2'-O)-methyltransferase
VSIEKGVLYVVATPIGHLADITYRAVDVLRAVDRIAAEDTRHARVLMEHYQIRTPVFAMHDHNEAQRAASVVARLNEGEAIALISDAGTPLINDPGYTLVNAVRAAGLRVVPIPGPSSIICALSAAGMPTDRFAYEGFLPHKASARRSVLQHLVSEPRTLVFLESSHRILESVCDMRDAFGAERDATLARELTKTFETFHRANLGEMVEWMQRDADQQRGEFVVMVAGYRAPEEVLSMETQRVACVLAKELSVKQAAALTAQVTGARKNLVYQWLLAQGTVGRDD